MAGLSAQWATIDVSCFDEADLESMLIEVRSAQRSLDGLVVRLGTRAGELADTGRCAPPVEMLRAGGVVGVAQARREAARIAAGAQAEGLGRALATGRISAEHVDSVARHIAGLTEEQLPALHIDDLIEQAAGLPPETFDRLVRRQVDTLRADNGLGHTIAKQAASEFRHWFDAAAGMGRFSGSLDPERYEALTSAVDQRTMSIAAAADDAMARDRNLAASALVELVTGATGGDARHRLPSVMVLVDAETMVGGPHSGSIRQTECGHDIAPESIARLCCDAVLRKVVLDDRAVPVNVGRKYRTATDAQWAAIKAVHATCAWGGCESPITWCQAHHIQEWERGGPTNLDNLIPLCSRHHHRVHEGGWHIKLEPDRTLHIHKPSGTLHETVPLPRRC